MAKKTPVVKTPTRKKGTPRARQVTPSARRRPRPSTPRRATPRRVTQNLSQDASSLLSSSSSSSSTRGSDLRECNVHLGAYIYKLREDHVKRIIQLKRSTLLQIPRLAFQRLVREILQMFSRDMLVQKSALEGLQFACEDMLVQFFEGSFKCALHGKRVTLLPKDAALVKDLKRYT